MVIDLDQIRLVSVVEGTAPDGSPGSLVTMGYFLSSRQAEPKLSVSWTMPKTYDDGEIVRLARSYFHDLCQRLADVTEPWKLADDEVARLRSDTKSSSPDSAAKA